MHIYHSRADAATLEIGNVKINEQRSVEKAVAGQKSDEPETRSVVLVTVTIETD